MRLGLTQGEFAARIGVSQGCVSRWEKGRHRPNPSVFMRLRRLGQATAQPPWHEGQEARTRLRLRPLETPRRRLSDHLRDSIDCALKAGRAEFVTLKLQPLLAACLEADRRDPHGRRSGDRASVSSRSA